MNFICLFFNDAPHTSISLNTSIYCELALANEALVCLPPQERNEKQRSTYFQRIPQYVTVPLQLHDATALDEKPGRCDQIAVPDQLSCYLHHAVTRFRMQPLLVDLPRYL